MVREFTLINSNNQSWTFTDQTFKVFLNNPSGLGFTRKATTVRYGNRQNLSDITDNFPQPTGEILFYDSANGDRYTEYNLFCRFITYEPLTLVYTVPSVSQYSLDCIVINLAKTESKQDGMLRCPVTFQGLSFWKGAEVVKTGTSASYTLTNTGDYPVGFEITIEGSPVNPYVQLEQDSELYGEAKFIDSTAFDSLYINSNDGEQNVILEQGGSVLPNPLGYQDLSISNGSIYVAFVKLARGESDLTIGMDSGSLTSVEIRFTPLYRSV